jgi:shikimate dehydrogenase-like protein
VIPADRVAAVFRGIRVEEDPRKEPPRRLDPRRGRAGALIWDNQDVKASFPDRAFVRPRKHLVAVRAVVRQDHPGFAPASIPHPLQMHRERLPLRFVIVQDVNFLPDELSDPDRHRVNIHGALVTMPHKVTTIPLLDEVMTTAKVAGACNAIRLGPGGTLVGDMSTAKGFVRGILRKGRVLAGARVLVVGSGGVGSAIVASLKIEVGSKDPVGFDVAVNATPLGMKDGDPLPMDVDRIAPSTFVGEVVMKREITPFLAAAGRVVAKSRSAPICCSSRFLPISSSSAFARLRRTNSGPLRRSTTRKRPSGAGIPTQPSALRAKAALGGIDIQLPLYPRKQTQIEIAARPKGALSESEKAFLRSPG